MGSIAQVLQPQHKPELVDADGLSAMQQAFLAAYPTHKTITATCRFLQMHPRTVSGWQEGQSPESSAFVRLFSLAKEAVGDDLEAELLSRAMEGRGQMPDTLGIFLLKGYKPQFRENYTVTSRIEGTINHVVTQLDTNDRQALLQMALEHERRLIAPPATSDDEATIIEG